MSLKFTQREIEMELRDCFPNGYIRDVSVISGIGESYLDRGINPNDEHESFTYRFLRVQCALDEKDATCGDMHWLAVARFRELSRPSPLTGLSLDLEAAANHKESFDVVDAVIRGQSLYDQLAEVNQQIKQAEKHKLAIIEAINHEKESPNGGRTRFNARQFAKDAVGKRR